LQPEIVPTAPENPEKTVKIWAFWPTIGFGLAIFAVYFIAQSVVAAIFAIIYALQELAANPAIDASQLIKSLSSNGLLVAIAVIVSGIAGAVFIILFIKIRKGITISEYLGLHPVGKRTIFILLAVVVGLLLISTGFDRVVKESQNTTFMVDVYKTSFWPPLLWIATVIFAPVFEEGFFRGFLFVGLKESFLGPIGTIILTALVFASLHALQYDVYGVATVFVLGIVFGIVRYKTGSLWSTMLMHSIWNLIGMIGTVLYINGIG
jgi:membrane protease YdiL (CAAX protease family)